MQRVEQTVVHKHVYEEPIRTSPTPTQARQVRKKGKGCGCFTFLMILLLIGAMFGSLGSCGKKSTSSKTSTRTYSSTSSSRSTTTKDPKATAVPTATPEPAIVSAQAVVDKFFAGAGAEEIAAVRAADSILYQSDAKKNGKVIEVRRSGAGDRGTVGVSKNEPNYVAALGYAAVFTEEKLEYNSDFAATPWQVPVYRKDKQFWEKTGTIDHKTEVVVIGQELEKPKTRYSPDRYTGYLHVIRTDTGEDCWLNVDNFVTKPYWKNSLTDAREKGYCIAIFRQKSDYYPVTKGKEKTELEDGMMVLLPMKTKVSGSSPDKTNNPVGGIVFKEWKYGFGGVTVWFNEEDLELTY